jgi:hypothetical protein
MEDTDTTEDERPEGGFGSVLRVRIELWLVVVFMALAFGAGIVVTALYDEPAASSVVGIQGTTGSFVAPPLTDDQIAGGLPSGHPDLGAGTGATGATGSTGSSGQGGGNGGGNGK